MEQWASTSFNEGAVPTDSLPPQPAIPLAQPASAPPPDPPSKQKRKLTLAACEPCRKRKSKCDGSRPVCSACVSKPELCVFEIKDANLSRTAALKQKVEALEGESRDLRMHLEGLANELSAKSELLEYLRTRPDEEAQVILQRWRTSGDIGSVVQYVRDGDLLIHSFNAPPGSSGIVSDELDNLDPAIQ